MLFENTKYEINKEETEVLLEKMEGIADYIGSLSGSAWDVLDLMAASSAKTDRKELEDIDLELEELVNELEDLSFQIKAISNEFILESDN